MGGQRWAFPQPCIACASRNPLLPDNARQNFIFSGMINSTNQQSTNWQKDYVILKSIWQKSMCGVSVIIPVYNEEEALPDVLDHLKKLYPKPLEILVVDGMSTDTTLEKAVACDVRALQCGERGRATQMHFGAMQARGEYLCFLHADTYVPQDLIAVVQRVLRDDRIALAAFVSLMKGDKVRYWFSFFELY